MRIPLFLGGVVCLAAGGALMVGVYQMTADRVDSTPLQYIGLGLLLAGVALVVWGLVARRRAGRLPA